MEKLRHTEAVDTAQDGLSQQKGATAVILDTKLEMSQRCELMMMMPCQQGMTASTTRMEDDSLDEMSPQCVSTKRASR